MTTTVVSDSFNRANSTTTLGNADTGQTWQYLNASNTASVFGITNNQAYNVNSGGDAFAYIDSGLSDQFTMQVTFAAIDGGADSEIGVYFWIQDYKNYYRIIGVGGSSKYYLQKKVAGTQTTVLQFGAMPTPGDILSVTSNSGSLTITLNGINYGPVSASSTATKHGIGQGQGSGQNKWDNFSISNNANSGTANTITLSDSVTTSDSLSLVRTLHVAISDSITSSDTIAKAVNRVLEFSDAVTSSDSLTNASAHNKSFSDSILSSDTFNKTSDIFLNISDSVILSDDTQKSTSHQISLSENISSSDSINNISAHSYDISLTDSVTSSDNILLSQAHAYSLSFSDSVTTSDADERSTSQYINDVIQATDVMNQVRNYLREYTDAISVEDNLVKQLASSLAINDPMTVIDSVTSEKVSVYTINLSDSITIADAITGLNRIFSLAINDNVSFSDSLTTEGGHVLQPLTVNIYLLASLDNKIELLAGASLVAQNDQDFTIEQYSSDTLIFTYSGDLSGCTLEWIMQYKVSSPSPLIKKTMGNGIAITSTSSTSSTFTVSITNEDMATIGRGDYYHQASVVDSLNESNPISKGTVSVLAASNN